MGCYNCEGPEGSSTILCPTCREVRASRDQSIRSAVNRKGEGLRGLQRFLREEWLAVVGILIMLAASINASFWLLYGDDRAAIEAPWARVGPDEVYSKCMASAVNSETVDLDFEQVQQGYAQEISEFLREHPESQNSREEVMRHIVLLRMKQSCTTARTACSTDPTGEECRVYAEQYVLNS